MPRLFPSLGALARALGDTARGMLVRGALLSAAWLIGVAGCGFVVFAGFAALRLVLTPQLSALVVGMTLLAFAAVLVRFSLASGHRSLVRKPVSFPSFKPSPASFPSTDPTTLAVFTAAFVLGRRLADRRRG